MDDDDISLLLAEPDTESRQAAFDAIVAKYWKPMCCYLNEQPGIQSHADQEDIVSHAFMQFHKHAKDGISLEGQNFRQLLFTIVKRRGTDHLRRRGAQRRGTEAYGDYLIDETRTILRREDASTTWLGLTSDGSAAAIMEDFRAAVTTLPPQQAAAARAVAMLLESNSALNVENIRDTMQAFTLTPVTLPSAKSAWSAVRLKLREFLRNRRP